MKRVLLVTSHPLAPPWDSADTQLARSIARRVEGYRFAAFVRAGSAAGSVHASPIPVWSRSGRPGLVERAQVAVLALAHEPTVDLVHAVVTIGPDFARLAALRRMMGRVLRRPAIHTVPGVRDPALLRKARAIGVTVALSKSTAALLESAGFSDVRVIPPGIPLESWPVSERPADEPPTVLFAGHYDRDGGAELAIEGVARAVRLGRPTRLVFAMRTRLGQDARLESERLRALAAGAGVDDVEVHGRVANLPALLRAASLVVFPASSLSGKADVPLVVLEAMASGRPVIVTDLPPFASLGDVVTRVPPDDRESLARAITSLLDSPERWAGQALAARRAVEQHFSDTAMAARYGDLYDEVLGDGQI